MSCPECEQNAMMQTQMQMQMQTRNTQINNNSEVMQLLSSFDCIKAGIVSLNKKMKVLREEADWRKARYETVIAKENIIAANTDYTTGSVNNPNYNRARLFIAAVFSSAHTGGLEVSMIYQNSPIGSVMTMKASNGSAGMISEPIDVKELSSFQFQIFNRDSVHSTTIRQARIILYNDY